MNQDPLTIYKLIVLYMLERVDFPLTNAQVCDYILGKGYTNYFTLQKAISELIDADMIKPRSIRNRTHLELTVDGRQTLEFFKNRLSSQIRNDIDAYFKENSFELKNDVSIVSNYYKSTSGEYEANLIVKEKNINLVNLTLSVPTEEIAASICDKWERESQEVYKFIVEKLF